MASLMDIFRDLEDKIDDLQRDTKFCINNYDYHHKNNEPEILAKIQTVLAECGPEADVFHKNMEQFKETIAKARMKCAELDDIMKEFGITEESVGGGSNCNTGNNSTATTGHSHSFREEDVTAYDGNKENMK